MQQSHSEMLGLGEIIVSPIEVIISLQSEGPLDIEHTHLDILNNKNRLLKFTLTSKSKASYCTY